MGLPLPVLKITDEREPVENKKVVVVTGRIHPGETNGSIVLAGLLRFLCSEEGAGLRRVAVFVVLPMMNPDGVVMGNYRTGAAGKDLNRVYTKINK
jgi:murein tripeptide amidase MpaA